MKNIIRDQISQNTLHFLRFIIGILAVLEISLALFYYLIHPPIIEFVYLTAIMSVTVVIALIVVYLAYRLGWINRSKNLRTTMLAGYGITMVIVILNTGLIAKLMFTDVRDAVLTGIVLVYATGLVMAFGFILSQTLTDRMNELGKAAEEIAQGNLAMRVPVTGNDELAKLGNTFNDMTIQLDQMDIRQRQMRMMRNELFAWIGHDLRTPLTSIRAILEALADRIVEDPDTEQRYLATAQKEVKYLSQLIDDLFDLSQVDAGGLRLDCQENSLTDLISDTIESFTELAFKQGINLEGSVEAGIDPVYMDAKLIGRVLTNLTSNALRYTPSGGSVTLHASRVAKRVQVEVKDNGDGIKVEDLPFVFERFYRGEKSRSRQTGGTGLGLAIARGIVELHGGQIRAESTEGIGTRMIFSLPEKKPSPESD
jgi:signal transduction histidine kinase